MSPEIERVLKEDKNYDALYRAAYLICGEEAGARKLLEDTVLQASAQGSGLRDSARLKVWLFLCLRKQAVKSVTVRKDAWNGDGGSKVGFEWLDVYEQNGGKGLGVNVEQLVQFTTGLGEPMRSAFAIYLIDLFDAKELGDVTGVKPEQLAGILLQARQRLAEEVRR